VNVVVHDGRTVISIDQVLGSPAVTSTPRGRQGLPGSHGPRAARRAPRVRERGYAHTKDEHEVGLSAIGAPVRTLDGRVIAAVTASGPTFRITEETLPDLAKHVLAAAGEISQRHGYPRRG
jgi:DNA-binding IclR family transcriptional regulator